MEDDVKHHADAVLELLLRLMLEQGYGHEGMLRALDDGHSPQSVARTLVHYHDKEPAA